MREGVRRDRGQCMGEPRRQQSNLLKDDRGCPFLLVNESGPQEQGLREGVVSSGTLLVIFRRLGVCTAGHAGSISDECTE